MIANLVNKLFNSWSDTNKKTNGQIELGFVIIGFALGACAVISIPLLYRHGAPYLAVLGALACIVTGMACTGFASKLKVDRLSNSELENDTKEKE